MIRQMFGRHAKLRISRRLWREIVGELHRRGGETRESGAFLLAGRGRSARTAKTVAYFDDLDPECLTGGITLAGAAFPRLWDRCEREGLRVIGDVHTHPRGWVGQSDIDRSNPMIAKAGHIALIVPDFARNLVGAGRVGVHEYLGDAGWRDYHDRVAERVLYIGWFA